MLAFSGAAAAGPLAEAGVARNAHFEVYSQAGPENARAVLAGFEQLRAYFLHQTGLQFDNRPPVRVIAFGSRAEYEAYRLRPAADAYYVGSEDRDTIVLPAGADGDIQVAAHEYAHFALHADGLRLPPWLDEGLSEFFATVRVSQQAIRTGASVPARARVLKNRTWMPLSEIVTLPADSPLRQQRESVDLFYAESWALTDMLIVSPAYRPQFPELIQAVSSGVSSEQALPRLYGKPVDAITVDLRAWVEQRRITPVALPSVPPGELQAEVSVASPLIWRSVLAELLEATGKLDRAQAAYDELARDAPDDANFSAALAAIALEKHDPGAARRHWQRAVEQGIGNAATCYRYAVLADGAGLPAEDVRPALERAVAIQPEFDNAHYILAHLDNNAGRYESALAHLRAMKKVTVARQFAYWAALAYALSELGRRDEAKAAAIRAREHATTDEERARAVQLAEIADTDLNVQFTRDANGNLHLVTTRVPHLQSWNPFIEPDDRIRSVEGSLRAVECGRPAPRLVIATSGGTLTLTIADPLRVQMIHAPGELTCGPQPPTAVTVVYAQRERTSVNGDGIVRGVEFH
jgi:hypothetical protein